MLPNSTVRRFDPLAQGSRLVTDGTGLAVAPRRSSRRTPRRCPTRAARGRPRRSRPTRSPDRSARAPPRRRVGRGAVRLHPAPRGRAGQHLRRGAGSRRGARLLRDASGPTRSRSSRARRSPRRRSSRRWCPADPDHLPGDHDHPGVRRVRGAGDRGTRRWWRHPSSSWPRQGHDPRACSISGEWTHDTAADQRGLPSWRRRPVLARTPRGRAVRRRCRGPDRHAGDGRQLQRHRQREHDRAVGRGALVPGAAGIRRVRGRRRRRGPRLRGPLPGRLGRRRRQPRTAAGLPGAVRAGDARPDPGAAGAAVRRRAVGRARPGLRRRAAQARRRSTASPAGSTSVRRRRGPSRRSSRCRRCTSRPSRRSSAATSTARSRPTSRP